MILQQQSYHPKQNFDSSWDGAFPFGDKSPTLAWSTQLPTLVTRLGAGGLSFDARAILGGDGASLAIISLVLITGSALTAWTAPGAGNICSNPGTSSGSGVFVLRATYLNLTVDSDPLPWSVSSGTATKIHSGHYIWFDSNTWSGAAARFNSYINALATDEDVRGVKIFFHWSEMEGAQGDYSAFFNIIDNIILPKLRACSPQKRLMMALWDRTFNVATATPSPSLYPSYAISAGYITSAPAGTTFGGVGSMINYGKPAALNSVIAMWQAIGRRYDSEPLIEMIEPSGETSVTNTAFGISNATWRDALNTLFTKIKPSWPTTLLRLVSNFSPSNDESIMLSWYQTLRALGGCCIGGPDPPNPISHLTSGQRLFIGQHLDGSASSNPDLRGIMPWVGEVQEQSLGTPFLTIGAPASIATFFISTMHAWHMLWNVEEWETVQFTRDTLPLIHSLNGLTNSGVPSEGNWTTS